MKLSAHGTPIRTLLVLCFLLFGSASPAHAAIPQSERDALISFYTTALGNFWTHNDGWCVGTCPVFGTTTFNIPGSECGWYGITCNDSQTHVTGITLDNNNMFGSFPALDAFSGLQSVQVSNNRLSGSLPNLSGLGLLFSFSADVNHLTGSIPALTGMAKLQTFTVESNRFTGGIPDLSGTDLSLVSLGHNQLTGPIPDLSVVSKIRIFEVGDNLLTGSIPNLQQLPNLLMFVAYKTNSQAAFQSWLD
jgi:hypothetical protein